MIAEFILLPLATLFSFLITYFTIPSVLDLAYQKNLFDIPDERKVHTRQIPSLGGIGIFIGMLVTFTLFCSPEIYTTYKFILVAYLVMFFMGIKDDLLPMAAKPKFILQIIVAIVLIMGGLQITSLQGLFGIYELPQWLSFCLSLVFIVGVTNAFNLIDGIDGLAGGLGGINCLTFGSLLLWMNDYNYALLAFAISGSLLAFLKYNFAAYPKKIFMGDAGSLILGLTIAILSIRFMESSVAINTLSIVSPIGIVIGIIFIPVFDMFRVFMVRILQGKSPFSADKNHIHHEFLRSGISHRNSSLLLYLGNILLIINVLFFKNQTAIVLLFLTMVVAIVYIYGLMIWRFKTRRTKADDIQHKLNQMKRKNQLIS